MKHYFECNLGSNRIRFYPNKSIIRIANKNCPVQWEDVDEVYFTWEVLYDSYEHYRHEHDKDRPLERVYFEHLDEGKGLVYLRQALKKILDGECTMDNIHILPKGCSTQWHIYKHEENTFYIYMSCTYGKSSGYCLCVNMQDLQKLYCVLDDFLEYMLTYGNK